MNWIIYLIIGIIALGVIIYFREEIWDFLVDGFSYILSFEWLGDLWELITGLFENISEFSVGGFAFGAMACVVVYFMIGRMTEFMSPTSKTVWTIATYVVSFVVGYFIGKKMFDD